MPDTNTPDLGMVGVTYDNATETATIRIAVMADIQVSYDTLRMENSREDIKDSIMSHFYMEVHADLPPVVLKRLDEAKTLLTHEGTKQ